MISLNTAALLLFVFLIGFIFALTNGLHDASSVVATFITCDAATPVQAIGVASVFGLLGAVFTGDKVADTISGVIDLPVRPSLLPVLFAAILGATSWNLITWKLGLPSSSTHALVGGIIGSVAASSGFRHVLWGWKALTAPGHHLTGIVEITAALIFSPLIGFALAFVLEKIMKFLLRNAKYSANTWIKRIQWGIAACLAYSHGSNDTQKVIGLFTLALAAGSGTSMGEAPLWVKISGGAMMFLGTMLGGWSIMKTVGRGIYTIRPLHSMNSQLASIGSILFATLLGAPVSTTHVVVGSVMGVGAADEYRMVHWSIVKDIVIAWVITIPLSAAVSSLLYMALAHFFQLT